MPHQFASTYDSTTADCNALCIVLLLKIITNFFIRPIILHTECRTDNITVIHVNKEQIHKLLFINSTHVYYFGKQQVVKGKT